jgi:hypothetical protein
LEREIILMRPIEFGEALAAGTRLTLFSDDEKPDLKRANYQQLQSNRRKKIPFSTPPRPTNR